MAKASTRYLRPLGPCSRPTAPMTISLFGRLLQAWLGGLAPAVPARLHRSGTWPRSMPFWITTSFVSSIFSVARSSAATASETATTLSAQFLVHLCSLASPFLPAGIRLLWPVTSGDFSAGQLLRGGGQHVRPVEEGLDQLDLLALEEPLQLPHRGEHLVGLGLGGHAQAFDPDPAGRDLAADPADRAQGEHDRLESSPGPVRSPGGASSFRCRRSRWW